MILTIVLLSLFLIFLILVAIYLKININRKKTGILGDILYKDTPNEPGKLLYSKSVPLVGKPDFIIKHNNMILPVEKKTGKTPRYPHNNHIMQLMAYCLLVEENYGARPTHGIISYPDRYFFIDYTDLQKSTLISLIYELQEYKQDKKTFDFFAIKNELCNECKLELN